MIEIPGLKKPYTYTLIMPEVYNLDKKLSSACITNLGLPMRKHVKDSETREPFIILEEYLSKDPLNEVLKAIFKQNERTRDELRRLFEDRFRLIDRINRVVCPDGRDLPWWHIFDLPKNDLFDDNPEFNSQNPDNTENSCVCITQYDETTELKIKEPDYSSLYKTTHDKIRKALTLTTGKNGLRLIK